MNIRSAWLSVVVGVCIAVAALSSAAAEFRTTGYPVHGQYIVVLEEGAATLAGERRRGPRVAQVAAAMGARHGARVLKSFDRALRGFVVKADDATLARLLADPRVAYVEEDGYMHTGAVQAGATWGIDRIGQRTLPLDGDYAYGTTASGVHTYIIDTGILGSHSQFAGRIGNGYSAINDGHGTTDCNGHGTHVAGTVGGATYGVAKGVTLHPVRVLGCAGAGTHAGVIAGMDWVAMHHVKPAVANMSLGGGGSRAMDEAVAHMTSAGVTVVVAAGNENADACEYSPARASSAITVGATTRIDARSSFSNWGACLDVFAPGSAITSAWHTSTTATHTLSGTSMAAPHVTGAVALYLALNPSATPAQVTRAITRSATQDKVSRSGSRSPNRLLYAPRP